MTQRERAPGTTRQEWRSRHHQPSHNSWQRAPDIPTPVIPTYLAYHPETNRPSPKYNPTTLGQKKDNADKTELWGPSSSQCPWQVTRAITTCKETCQWEGSLKLAHSPAMHCNIHRIFEKSLHFSIQDKRSLPNTLYQYHNMYRQCVCVPIILYYFMSILWLRCQLIEYLNNVCW